MSARIELDRRASLNIFFFLSFSYLYKYKYIGFIMFIIY